jgi:hypothetical protein
MDYDYAELAAAMDSDSGDDDGDEADQISGGSGGSDSEPGSCSGSGSGLDGEEVSEEEGASSGRQLVGASFSDMSGSEDEEEQEEGGSSSGEEGGLSDPEAGDSESSDGEFEAQLAAGDLLFDGERRWSSSAVVFTPVCVCLFSRGDEFKMCWTGLLCSGACLPQFASSRH